MRRYKLYFNEVYDGVRQVEHDGVVRFVDAVDVFEAMDKAFKMGKELGCHAYRLVEGGAARHKLTAAFCSWYE